MNLMKDRPASRSGCGMSFPKEDDVNRSASAAATAKLPHRPAARSPLRTKHASILRGILT